MTEYQMTVLCAQAMGYVAKPPSCSADIVLFVEWQPHPMLPKDTMRYDPLDDDAQAMELVKRFHLHFHPPVPHGAKTWWVHTNEYHEGREAPKHGGTNENLNRAIVECVAKMQSAVVAH
jgi:hypothetical protein